jgi:hypothetical protein
VSGASFAYGALWLPWRHLDAFEGDFSNYYQAAAHLRMGSSPYRVHAFDYPPLPAFVVVPLTVLPYDLARRAWLLFGQASLVAAAWCCWRALGAGRAALLAVAMCWGVAGTLAENLVLGQLHPPMLLLLALAFALLDHRPSLAGALVGVASALKLWPALLLLALATTRLRAALAGGAVALLLMGLPLVVLRLGWPPPHLPTSASYWMGTPAPLNVSLSAVGLRVLEAPVAGAPLPVSWRLGDHPAGLELSAAHRAASVAIAVLAVTLGGAAIAWVFRGRSQAAGGRRSETATGNRHVPAVPERELLLLTATLSMALLASPISWYHYQVFQLLPASLLAWRWLRRRAAWPVAGLLVLLAGLTRAPSWALGSYVGHFGWEGSNLPLLWLATTLGPVLGIGLFLLLVVELRGAAAAETAVAGAAPRAA